MSMLRKGPKAKRAFIYSLFLELMKCTDLFLCETPTNMKGMIVMLKLEYFYGSKTGLAWPLKTISGHYKGL